MSNRRHWETVYHTKGSNAVSWYAPHLDTSVHFIEATGVGRDAQIIDVGGGASTLVDDLLARGYHNLTVVDLAESALAVTRQRLGAKATGINWLVGDITELTLPCKQYDLWHDRAVFHFLTTVEARRAYIKQVCCAIKDGGYLVMATFGPHGPKECSGLPVARYSSAELHGLFGHPFVLVDEAVHEHATPSGSAQEFVYCCCLKKGEC
jgi:ubiquinone/menaquinone biosynthesis C-methylase UbiE